MLDLFGRRRRSGAAGIAVLTAKFAGKPCRRLPFAALGRSSSFSGRWSGVLWGDLLLLVARTAKLRRFAETVNGERTLGINLCCMDAAGAGGAVLHE